MEAFFSQLYHNSCVNLKKIKDAKMTKTGGTGKNLKSGKGSISVNKNVILLIEDEEKLSRTLAEYLELNGYRVLRALNGLEAVDVL